LEREWAVMQPQVSSQPSLRITSGCLQQFANIPPDIHSMRSRRDRIFAGFLSSLMWHLIIQDMQ
jgi:hypothetical protein